MVQVNYKTSCNSVSPMLQRGNGYRLPTLSAFQPLENGDANNPAVTAAEIVDGVEWFHDQGVHPKCICFGGAYSEPLASFSAVAEAMVAIREHRHGTPMVLMSNGLNQQGVCHTQAIIDMHEKWRDAPGSDGDSKFSVFVSVGGASPPEYDKVMQPSETKKGFQEVCGFISNLVDSGVKVYGTGSNNPSLNSINQVEAVSLGLGCSDFFVRSYHPRTLYDVLDIPDATSDLGLIKKSYRTKAKALHPDVQGQIPDPEKVDDAIREVNEAYKVLSDENLRSLYESGVADLILNDHEEDYFRSVVNKSV